MCKVIVIGCPGAGKSTFARKLRNATNLPLYYLDMLWHKEDKTNISREEFDTKLKDVLKKDKWIIDGNYLRTLEMRLKECDTVFLLDYPLEVCLDGAKSRIGKKREDMPWVESELDEEFKKFIEDFSKDQLPQVYELIEKYSENRKIIVFKSRAEAEEYIKYNEKGGKIMGELSDLPNIGKVVEEQLNQVGIYNLKDSNIQPSAE